MGSSSSKFKKYLTHGDEFAAMQLFYNSTELQKSINPNLSYGEHYNHDTPLHCTAKHGMKHLLRTFLFEHGGNPNKRNGSNETCLHAACQLKNNKSFSAMERRAACLACILQWKGVLLESGVREKVDLAAQDQNGNTALHLAAAFGLEFCVEILTSAGSPLYLENSDKMTPCDLAVKNGHHLIAQFLESKMVFGDTLDFHNEEEFSQNVNEMDEVYCGLRLQDLQEAKDQLLVETSDMLQVPLFTAEALLRDNEWSREVLLEKWMKDAVTCCQLAGVEPPQSAFNHDEVMLDSVSDIPPESQNNICDICMLSMKESDQPSIKISCNHNFCFQCWETYLSNKIIEGMQHYILCPAYQCHILVPIEVIESLVSPDLARRYLHFDIKAFVESNKYIKWCPVAGCGRAVRLPESEQAQPTDELKMTTNGKPPPLTSHAVDCGNGHFFCWECLGEAHAPSGCIQWRQWLDKVSQVRPEQLSNDMKDLEDASNCLWLVSNSKPCPNCKSPIQKNEGCNHIKCSKCKYDFCWVCLEAWKKHSSATGGYFRCNRFSAVSKADERQGVLMSEAVARSQQIQELNRFLHYYTRFKNHEHSRKLEETLLTAVKPKMQVLASSLANGKEVLSEKEKSCTKFIEDGVRELLKARRVLCGSYVHGFYLEDNGYNKTIFEFMQNELETVTEKLSEMIARPYLKTPRHTIMQTTSLSRRKRHEFVRAVSKGLIPPETPPSFRKKKRKCPGVLVMDTNNEEELSQVIVASLKSFDANNPWVKDQHGRHNNLSAIYDWPDSDEETEVGRALAVSLVGECIRNGCTRPRARNPRTHALHDYCSLRCAGNEIQVQNVPHDDSMDLIIALEMSRLQMIEDKIKRENQSVDKPNTSISVTQTNPDPDLSKAIELSIRQQKTDVGVTTEDINPFDEPAPETNVDFYRRTNEDLTVDYFLKTLAGQNLEDISQETESIDSPSEEKDIGVFGPQRTEDGRFEIGDIHETCFHQDEKDEQCLRRVHSTGDLCHKDGEKEKFREETRYHLDSDHSSQHDDKPEDIAQKRMSFHDDTEESDDKVKTGCRFLFFQENSEGSTVDEGTCNQSSIDDTTASDSLNADIEVSNILSSEKTERMSINDDFFSFQSNSNISNSTYRDSSKSSQLNVLETTENFINFDHVKPCTVKKVRMNLDGKISSDRSSPLRKTSEKENVRMENFDVKKCESVKNLMELQNSLKSVESERSTSPDGAEGFSSPNRPVWQNSLFDFNNRGVEFLRHCPERASTGKIKSTDYTFPIRPKSGAKSATALENLKEAEKQLSYNEKYNSKKVLLAGSERSLNEAHKRAFKAAGGKIPCKKDSKSGYSSKECMSKGNSNLKIRIAKSPVATDSSNEYETDTGIPKSPTLFISGVSISRTPEPPTSSTKQDKKSPEHKTPKFSPLFKDLSHRSMHGKNNSSPILNLIPPSIDFDDGSVNDFRGVEENLFFPEKFDDKFLSCGRQGRSASLTVSKSDGQKDSGKRNLNSSCNAISTCQNERKSVNRKDESQVFSFSPRNSIIGLGENEKCMENEFLVKNSEGVFIFPSFSHKELKEDLKSIENYPQERNQNSLTENVKKTGKAKSASEPEREREMFRFPKSSTDGALSSVLHIQENNLSSDDFHEVLFLLERSPKHGSKRKKKSKKERDKVKENINKDECTEVSSVL